MADHGEQGVAPSIHFGDVKRDRFGDSLVDRFVETDEVRHRPRIAEPAGFRPQTHHHGAQHAVFGDDLGNGETHFGAHTAMRLRRRFASDMGSKPLGLGDRLLSRLRLLQIQRDGGQDMGQVIAQNADIDGAIGQYRQGLSELDRVSDDFGVGTADEVRKGHVR